MRRGRGSRLERLWYPLAADSPPPPVALRAAAALHALIARARAAAYDRGVLAARRLPVACLSVGNLTVGGTGKTPLVAWLLEALTALGARPAVVSRGYRGSERGPVRVDPSGRRQDAARFGDEPAMLAARFPAVPVVVGADRYAAGMLAAAEGATAVVADDAFQHRRLGRDLDIVAVDAWRGFGNGRQLPAGPLREAPGGLSRAGAVVLTGAAGAPGLERLRRVVAALAPGALLAEADLAFAGWRAARGEEAVELAPGARVFAFSGVAHPGSFRRTLEAQGLQLRGWEEFPDHHAFRADEVLGLARAAAAAGAVAAVTTAKDAVRLDGWPDGLPLYRAEVKLVMIQGRETLWERLKSIVSGGSG